MSFRVGDLVRCINNSGFPALIINKEYLVSFVDGNEIGIDSATKRQWHDWRFELVQKEPEKSAEASKNDQDKPDLSLIPYVAEVAEAQAFMVGEKKYGRYNYCKGHKASKLVAAARRHLNAWFQGEENDPKDGQPHLGSVRACVAMLLRQQELGTLIDDRYKPEVKS